MYCITQAQDSQCLFNSQVRLANSDPFVTGLPRSERRVWVGAMQAHLAALALHVLALVIQEVVYYSQTLVCTRASARAHTNTHTHTHTHLRSPFIGRIYVSSCIGRFGERGGLKRDVWVPSINHTHTHTFSLSLFLSPPLPLSLSQDSLLHKSI